MACCIAVVAMAVASGMWNAAGRLARAARVTTDAIGQVTSTSTWLPSRGCLNYVC